MGYHPWDKKQFEAAATPPEPSDPDRENHPDDVKALRAIIQNLKEVIELQKLAYEKAREAAETYKACAETTLNTLKELAGIRSTGGG